MRKIIAALLVLFAVSPASAAAEQAPTPQRCATNLDCGLDEIDKMSISDRLSFVRLMSAGPVAEFLPDTDPGRWRNIEGILTLFRNQGLGAPGGWVSYTDAGILEGVERGIAIATGRSTETGGNPGAPKWAGYLTRLAAGELTTRAAHDKAWSEAEQAATEHGKAVAEQVHDEFPSAVEARFYANSELYRLLLRNRLPVIDLLPGIASPGCQGKAQNFYDWSTDVTNATAGRTGAELLFSIADLQAPNALLDTTGVLHAYLDEMCLAYQRTLP